jgi:hypothetical protein
MGAELLNPKVRAGRITGFPDTMRPGRGSELSGLKKKDAV